MKLQEEIIELCAAITRSQEENSGLRAAMDRGVEQECQTSEEISSEFIDLVSSELHSLVILLIGLSLFVSIGLGAWVDTLVTEKATAQVALQEEQNTHATMENAVDALCRALGVRRADPEPSSLVARMRGRLISVYKWAQILVTDAFHHGVWRTLAMSRA